jgi:hypothetical protein
VLKYASTVLTAAFGIYALKVDYKRDGQVTEAGRRAIAGTVASGLIALLTQAIESRKQYQDEQAQRERISAQLNATRDAQQRAEETLNQVLRGVYLLQDVQVKAALYIPLTSENLVEFRSRLEPPKPPGDYFSQDVLPGSPQYPTGHTKQFKNLLAVLRNTNVLVDVNKPPLTDDQIRKGLYDLEFSAHQDPLRLSVNFRDMTVRLHLDRTPASVRNSNEKIQAMTDLAGAQIVIEIANPVIQKYELGYEDTLYPEVRVAGISLKSGGHEFYFGEESLRLVELDPFDSRLMIEVPKHHRYAYVAIFPLDPLNNKGLLPPG